MRVVEHPGTHVEALANLVAEESPCTPFWQSVRERFMPPIATEQLPQSLLERFDAGLMTDRLMQSLRFITPLSTRAVAK